MNCTKFVFNFRRRHEQGQAIPKHPQTSHRQALHDAGRPALWGNEGKPGYLHRGTAGDARQQPRPVD